MSTVRFIRVEIDLPDPRVSNLTFGDALNLLKNLETLTFVIHGSFCRNHRKLWEADRVEIFVEPKHPGEERCVENFLAAGAAKVQDIWEKWHVGNRKDVPVVQAEFLEVDRERCCDLTEYRR